MSRVARSAPVGPWWTRRGFLLPALGPRRLVLGRPAQQRGEGWRSDGLHHFFRTRRKNRREERPDHRSAQRHGLALRETPALPYGLEGDRRRPRKAPSGLGKPPPSLNTERENSPTVRKAAGNLRSPDDSESGITAHPPNTGAVGGLSARLSEQALPMHHAPARVAAGVVRQRAGTAPPMSNRPLTGGAERGCRACGPHRVRPRAGRASPLTQRLEVRGTGPLGGDPYSLRRVPRFESGGGL